LIRGNVVYLQNKLKNEIEMFGLGFQEILVIALIILLLFGGKKIPELMRGLGKGVKSFKEGMNEVTDLKKEVEQDEKKDE
jgi:sec-independent protein translocase protein TatA